MMEFLDKIYGYEHFGIILFAVIAVLVVLFLVVLFFGKKDEKKRELERTQKLAAEQVADAFAPINAAPTAVNIEEPVFAPVENIVTQTVEQVAAPVMNDVQSTPVQPVVTPVMPVEPMEPEIPVAPILPSEPVAPVLEPVVAPELITPTIPATPVVEPEVKLEPVNIPIPEPVLDPIIKEEPKAEIEIPNFNFDELAASIASELNELESKPVAPVYEEKITKPEEVIRPVPLVEKPIAPTPTPGPAIFSSVYINKPTEPAKEVQVVEPKPVMEEVTARPETTLTNNNIELPKPVEMPKLNNEVQNSVNNIPNAVPDFSQFEGESYNIK